MDSRHNYPHVFAQINMLLNFKDEKQECPCPEYIREQLLDFHEDLMRHCGKLPISFTYTAKPNVTLTTVSSDCSVST